MTWEKKRQMLVEDPPFTNSFFHNRLQPYIDQVLKNDKGPLGKIKDYVYKIEF